MLTMRKSQDVKMRYDKNLKLQQQEYETKSEKLNEKHKTQLEAQTKVEASELANLKGIP